MATTIQSLKIKSVEEIRDDYLRHYRNSLIKRGILNPDVSEGTEIFLRATSLASQIYVASTNVPLAADAQMADSALGDDLVRLAGIYRLALRPAGPSAGPLVLSATVSTALGIPAGSQLIDPSGLLYEVATGGTYTSGGSPIPIRSLATGAGTNLPVGTVLRWVAPGPFINTTATVGVGGLTGGVDAEGIEGLRARLLERLQTPPNGVNWSSIVAAAEGASTAVQKGFVFPAANGPSTVHVAVVRAPTAGNRGRDVAASVMVAEVVPGVAAALPEFVEVTTTTVQNYPITASFGVALPASPKSSPAGAGGGWTDATPFPVYAASGFVGVVVVTDSTHVAVLSDVAPVIGSQVCWLSTDDWTLRTAKVTAFSAVGAQYSVTLDTPLVSKNGVTIAVGDFVFPNADRMPQYIAAILDGFAAMGPHEKTSTPGLLPRALRRPLAATSWPSELKRPFLRNLTDAGEEVGDADYLYRTAITPPLPTVITDPPYIVVPGRIGVYPI